MQSFLNQVMYNAPATINRDLLERVSSVTEDQMKAVLNKYNRHLFDFKTSNMVVVSGVSKAEVIILHSISSSTSHSRC
jgi:ribosomal protein L18E